jgi:hypothetical protein
MIEGIEEMASSVGGVAPRRAVAKAVERYASEKLERDRRVVEGARQALKTGSPLSDTSPDAGGAGEGTSPSRSAARARTGMTPAPGTVPRLFTHTRTPNPLPVPSREKRITMRGMVPAMTPEPAGAAPLPPPPPPVGAAYHPPVHSLSAPRRTLDGLPAAAPARGSLLLVVVLCALAVLAGGWLALQLAQPAPPAPARTIATEPSVPVAVTPPSAPLPPVVEPQAPPPTSTATPSSQATAPGVTAPKGSAVTPRTSTRKPSAAPTRPQKPATQPLMPNPYTR